MWLPPPSAALLNIKSNIYIFTTPNLKSYRTRDACVVCTQYEYIIFSETR